MSSEELGVIVGVSAGGFVALVAGLAALALALSLSRRRHVPAVASSTSPTRKEDSPAFFAGKEDSNKGSRTRLATNAI